VFATSVDLDIQIGKGIRELSRKVSFIELREEKKKLIRRGTLLVNQI